MGGMAVSMVLMGSVSDNYGRQRTCLWCQVVLVIFSFLQMASQSVVFFSVCRFVHGFVVSSGYAAAFVYLTEIVDADKRAKLGEILINFNLKQMVLLFFLLLRIA